MASEKDEGIVIRLIEFSESSCVVTLFTDRFGKITALAKGARRPKSAFEAALDLLAVCRIVFLHKTSSTLDLLTEAKLERRFRAASRDLSRLYAGYYVAELLNALTDEGDPHPELFRIAKTTLIDLDSHAAVPLTVLKFELAALRELGHFPQLDACAVCGDPIEGASHFAFGHLAGGVLCSSCRPGQRQVARLRAKTVHTLRSLADNQTTPGDDMLTDRRHAGELRGVLNQYVSNLLGHKPKMHRFLGMFS